MKSPTLVAGTTTSAQVPSLPPTQKKFRPSQEIPDSDDWESPLSSRGGTPVVTLGSPLPEPDFTLPGTPSFTPPLSPTGTLFTLPPLPTHRKADKMKVGTTPPCEMSSPSPLTSCSQGRCTSSHPISRLPPLSLAPSPSLTSPSPTRAMRMSDFSTPFSRPTPMSVWMRTGHLTMSTRQLRLRRYVWFSHLRSGRSTQATLLLPDSLRTFHISAIFGCRWCKETGLKKFLTLDDSQPLCLSAFVIFLHADPDHLSRSLLSFITDETMGLLGRKSLTV